MQTLLTYAKHTGMDVSATPQSIESQASALGQEPGSKHTATAGGG
jgi:hypothetical protein